MNHSKQLRQKLLISIVFCFRLFYSIVDKRCFVVLRINAAMSSRFWWMKINIIVNEVLFWDSATEIPLSTRVYFDRAALLINICVISEKRLKIRIIQWWAVGMLVFSFFRHFPPFHSSSIARNEQAANYVFFFRLKGPAVPPHDSFCSITSYSTVIFVFRLYF